MKAQLTKNVGNIILRTTFYTHFNRSDTIRYYYDRYYYDRYYYDRYYYDICTPCSTRAVRSHTRTVGIQWERPTRHISWHSICTSAYACFQMDASFTRQMLADRNVPKCNIEWCTVSSVARSEAHFGASSIGRLSAA